MTRIQINKLQVLFRKLSEVLVDTHADNAEEHVTRMTKVYQKISGCFVVSESICLLAESSIFLFHKYSTIFSMQSLSPSSLKPLNF